MKQIKIETQTSRSQLTILLLIIYLRSYLPAKSYEQFPPVSTVRTNKRLAAIFIFLDVTRASCFFETQTFDVPPTIIIIRLELILSG